MQFIQTKESMDILSSTYECQYVNEDIAWITLNKTDQLGSLVLISVKDMVVEVFSIQGIHGHIVHEDMAWIALNITDHLG